MVFSQAPTPQEDIFNAATNSFALFWNSPFIFVVKIFIAIYVSILIVDIVLLLILRGIGGDIRTGLKGMNIPVVSKGKMQKRWDKIMERLSSDNESQYKVAVIEADALVDEILAGIGYGGQNMSERFDQIGSTHLDSHYESLREAHNVRNRIVHEADFAIDHKTASNVLQLYENFLKYLEYLD